MTAGRGRSAVFDLPFGPAGRLGRPMAGPISA
jgi:hypothetical protein